MNKKTSLLIYCFTASFFVSGTVFAETSSVDSGLLVDQPGEAQPPVDVSVTEEGELLVPEHFISPPVLSTIELGIGYVSDDAFKFGRYNGWQTQGAFLIADIKLSTFDESGRFWRIRATNLGLESRYLRLEGGVQGSHKFFLEYDEQPNYKNNTQQTPFAGIGSDNLTLPTGFAINTNLNDNLNSFDLKTKRERIKTGAVLVPKDNWQFDIDYSHETKQGTEISGAAIGNGSTKVIGSTTMSLITEPVDQETDQVNAILRYAGDDAQLDLKYHMSLFDNNYDSLSWQNPHPAPVIATGVAPVAGSMSLAPDNEFHQLSLNGGYSLPYRSRLTGLFSMGRMTQNQDFLPYTINPGVSASLLPQNALDGEVWLTNAQLKLTSRPVSKLRLNAELRYSERDNKTPVNSYSRVVLDSHSSGSIDNRPYSYKNNRIKLDANYRFNAITSLRGGYKYNEMKRSYTGAERDETEEDTIYAKWKIKAHSTVDLSLLAESARRDGSEYVTAVNENPAMRKYYLADRDRTKFGASIDYMATEKLFLSARADYNKDEYTNSSIGLTEAIQPVYTVDFSYQPRHNITTYGYYTYENIESSQAGEDVSIPPSGTATSDIWNADFDDVFDTVGLGIKWTGLGRWDIGADAVYSKSRGVIELSDLNNPGTEAQYPDTKTALASIKLWCSYNYSRHLSYKLGYWFEDYTADNWAVDDVPVYDPLAIESSLLLGGETLDYNVHVITISASYSY